MALAITDFEALSSFAPHQDLQSALATVPELREAVGAQAADDYNASTEDTRMAALRTAFTGLMTADADAVAETIAKLTARLAAEKEIRTLSPKEELVLRLQEQYPNDVGILSVFFLNLVTLEAGQAIYLAGESPAAC